MAYYHLAQINAGRIVAPTDSPIMHGFMSQLEAINAIADRSPGFVWRLQTDAGNATSVLAFDHPFDLLNMSVWESVETLKEYVYKSAHIGPLKDRLKWFEKPTKPHIALWWIPAGHIPTVAEAVERLEFRRAMGDTPVAFSFVMTSPMPDAPASGAAEPRISFENRRFVPAVAPKGDCDPRTKFHYRQRGLNIWATYSGGNVRFGSLVAASNEAGLLDMRYHHVDPEGVIRTGVCMATPEILPDGRLLLHEEWQRTSDGLAGRTVMEELRG
jgi:hypothetical protein